ncbi:hypothetical protein B5M09_000660 [Aphanomyces astaci]|uniref:B30.2/SPRY domain-containing protein n=1 Tax=Aphanomyces astaci TaxID=112090 RepID=A0A3R7WGC8_APHAT|nr:hypothetical protein B5M09_000660 [Aphanomyces astaci]
MPSSPKSIHSDEWSETSEVPCTGEVESEMPPDETSNAKEVLPVSPADGEERVWHEVDMSVGTTPQSPHKSTSTDASSNRLIPTHNDVNQISTILDALQDECDRSYDQVHLLMSRLRGMPDDMQLFLEGHLNALERQRGRLNVQASALRQFDLASGNEHSSDTNALLECKPARPKLGRSPKHPTPPPSTYHEPKRAKVDHAPPRQRQQNNQDNATTLRWDPARVGIHATVSGRGGARLKTTRLGWNVAMGSVKVSSFCVRVNLPKSKHRNAIAIGFIKEPKFWEVPHGAESVFVFNYSGWYINVRKGSLCSLQGHDDTPFASPFKDGDTLEVMLDHSSKTLSFVHNGTHLGIAYSNVDDTELFPALISYDARVQLTFVAQ